MSAWQQEIDLIIQGRLKEAAEVYHAHRPDVGLVEAVKIIADVARTMNAAFAKFHRKVEVKSQ